MIDPNNLDYSNTPASSQRPCFLYLPQNPAMAPAVSIITAFYNAGEIFIETARSVLNQSFQQWEWLIINDGSTDPVSLNVLETYRHGDPRIRVIEFTGNQGASAARNRGFAEARTDYCCLLDSDDLLEPTAIEEWYWFLETHPEWSFVGGYSVGFGAQEYIWRRGFQSNEENLEENVIPIASLVRRAVILSVGGFNPNDRGGLDDWEFWLRCASHGYWGTTIPEFLSWYRRRSSHTDRWENWKPEKKEKFRADLKRHFPVLWEGGFPKITSPRRSAYQSVLWDISCENQLDKRASRLLLILPFLSMGGATKFNLDLIQQLKARGWEVTIVTTLPESDSWAYELSLLTPDIFILENFLPVADWPRFFKYLISSRSFDAVLLSNSLFGYQLLPFIRAEFPGLPVLDFIHSSPMRWLSGGYPRISSLYRNDIDLTIASSQALRDWMIKAGSAPEKLEVCTTNVDVEIWHPDPEIRQACRNKLKIDPTTPLIVYNARIVQEKQPQVFIRTIQQLHLAGLAFRALVIGDGPMLGWLKQYVEANQLGGVVDFLGVLPNLEVQSWMKAGDILFLPSEIEGIASAIYEAMATELVPVSADVGGQKELLTPDCGYLVSHTDEGREVVDYAQLLEQLIRNPERRQSMGKAGRKRVQQFFRIEQMGERIALLLGNAIEAHRLHPGSPVSKKLARVHTQEIIEARYQQDELERYIQGLQEAKVLSDRQLMSYFQISEKSKESMHELEQYNADLLKAKDWLDEQRKSWMEIAEQREVKLQELEQYNADLLKAKTWLEEQFQNWEERTKQREIRIGEMEQYVADLLEGKAWLEEQWQNWMQIALQRQKTIDELNRSFADRLDVSLPTPITDEPSSTLPAESEESKGSQVDEQ